MQQQVSLGLIWAQGRNGIIGHQGQMPWHLPEDLAHFKAQTMGCPVIMGRKTWDSIPAPFRPLPGRRNIVITRQAGWLATGAEGVASIEEALRLCSREAKVWVLGGGQIYEQALPYADTVEMTQIDLQPQGDTRAPKLDDEWSRAETSEWSLSSSGLRYRFVTFKRVLLGKSADAAADAGFSSTVGQTTFPSTHAPPEFANTQEPLEFVDTQSPNAFEDTAAPSGFSRTLPPGLLP